MIMAKNVGVDALSGLDKQWNDVDLCSSCIGHFEDKQFAKREEVWRQLPAIFDLTQLLPSWPDSVGEFSTKRVTSNYSLFVVVHR